MLNSVLLNVPAAALVLILHPLRVKFNEPNANQHIVDKLTLNGCTQFSERADERLGRENCVFHETTPGPTVLRQDKSKQQ